MLNFYDIFSALQLAVFAYVFSCILIAKDGIFDFYGDFLYYKIKERTNGKLANALGLCEKCFAGQTAFWFFIAANINEYDIIKHILFTCFTIIFTQIISETIKQIKNAR